MANVADLISMLFTLKYAQVPSTMLKYYQVC
jgi:hypothetical protein